MALTFSSAITATEDSSYGLTYAYLGGKVGGEITGVKSYIVSGLASGSLKIGTATVAFTAGADLTAGTFTVSGLAGGFAGGNGVSFSYLAVASDGIWGIKADGTGSIKLSSTATLTWTPAADFNGLVDNAFYVKDYIAVTAGTTDANVEAYVGGSGAGMTTGTAVGVDFTVSNVNDAPTIALVGSPTYPTTLEGVAQTIAFADLQSIATVSDIDTATINLSYIINTVDTTKGTLTKNGVAVVAGTTTIAAGETLVWTPIDGNINGTVAAFTIKGWDGSLASTTAIAVNVAVTAVNDAPTGTSSTISITENGSKTFSAGDFGFADAADAAGQSINGTANTLANVIITTLPTVGTLKLNGVDVTVGQSIAVADLGTLVYTPVAQATGAGYATIGFKVQDNGGTANSGVDTSVSANTLTIDVSAVNDAPVNTAVPTVSGTAHPTHVLTATVGTWNDSLDGSTADGVLQTAINNGSAVAYQWQTSANGTSGWTNIGGATSATYTPIAGDVTQYVRAAITVTDSGVGTPTNQSTTAYSTATQITNTTPTISALTSTTSEGTSSYDLNLLSGATDANGVH